METSGRALDYASDEIRPKVWAELMVNDNGAAKLKANGWPRRGRRVRTGFRLRFHAYRLKTPRRRSSPADFMLDPRTHAERR